MTLLLLVSGHFLCDYPLQGDFIGKFKNRHLSREAMGFPPHIPWWHLMTAHAFIHAGMVAIITQRLDLAIIELVAHFIIDVLKCEGHTNIHIDQALHIWCKLAYVGLM